eukprot:4280734-Alexandrium_andersonii.AAC.1
MSIADHAKYLGILLGPGAGDGGWDAPILKFQARELQWAGQHLGIFYNLRAYRIFAFSTLQFFLQFYGDKDEALQAEAKAMKHISPGPGMWRTPRDLWALRAQLGLPIEIPNLRSISIASKVRLYFSEPFLRECDWHETVLQDLSAH